MNPVTINASDSNTVCPECQRLHKELADLRRQNDEIQRQNQELQQRLSDLEAAQRRDKRQAAPFGRDQKKANPKKPGRRKGQGRFSFRRVPEKIEHTQEVPLHHCPECFGPVSDLKEHEHFQTDLPLPQPVTTRFVTYSGYCPCCKKRVQSRHHEQVSTATGAAGVSLGPHARALAADLHHGLGVPFAKVARLFSSAFGLSVTPGALCQSGSRLADVLEPIYQELQAALRTCQAVHADETGWRVGALSAWLWTFTNEKITVYCVESSRGHEAVLRVLGKEFTGTLICDCFAAYDAQALSAWLQQKCLGHLLKDFSALAKEKTGIAQRFSIEVAAVLREAITLKREKSSLPEPEYLVQVAALQKRLDALIHERRRFRDADNRRLANRLRKQRSRLFTFLTRDGVDATNNRAERSLRPAVIVRKTGGCNKSEEGARVHGIVTSIIVTARQQGLNPVVYLAKSLVDAAKIPSLTDLTDLTDAVPAAVPAA
jgi:transposase